MKPMVRITIILIILSQSFQSYILPYDFNIFSFNKQKFNEWYYESLLFFAKMIKNSYNKTSSEEQKNIEKLYDICASSVLIAKSNESIFFEMFLSSNLKQNSIEDYGDLSLCSAIKPNDNSSSSFIYIYVKDEQLEQNKNTSNYALCYPEECNQLMYKIHNDIKDYNKNKDYNSSNMTSLFNKIDIFIFPYDSDSNNISKYVLVGYLCYFIILIIFNIFGYFFFKKKYNPYDINRDLSFSAVRDNSVETFTEQNQISAQPTFLYDERGCFEKFYFTFLSISNFLYILIKTKTTIYNDKKLKLLNGFIILFLCLKVFSDVYLDFNVISNYATKMTSLSYTGLLPKIDLGLYFIDIFSAIFGFIFCYKLLFFLRNRTRSSEQSNQVTKSLILIIFKQFDKIFLVIFFNFLLIIALTNYLDSSLTENVNWVLQKSNFFKCDYINYLPLFFNYDEIRNKYTCYNGLGYFFTSFYLLIYGVIIMRVLYSIKRKYIFLAILFLITFSLRLAFPFLYHYLRFEPEGQYTFNISELKFYNEISKYFEISARTYSFFHLPCFIFGMSFGLVLFNSRISSFQDKNCFSNKLLRNLFYWGSVALFLFLLFFRNFFFNIFVDSEQNISIVLSLILYSIFSILIANTIIIIISSIKIKSSGTYKVTEIAFFFLKKIFRSPVLTILGRASYIVILIQRPLTIFLIFFLDPKFLLYDIQNVFDIYGIPIFFIVFLISLLLVIAIYIPIRITMKSLLKLKSK